MSIESAPGQGTTVILRLAQCEEHSEMEVAKAAPERTMRTLQLLVVDDDPAVRASIAGSLMEDGHSVECVASATSALPLLEERAFDLVIADFLMPNMTGAQLINAAREIRGETPFLLVSGYSDSEELAAASATANLLRKPFTFDELRTAIAQALDLSETST
jgi:CheY-like chemotaxis protein